MSSTSRKKDPSLLYLEVPVYLPDSIGKRSHEIFVDEGDSDDNSVAEASYYPDSGGGREIPVLNTNMKRNLYWRTHSNTLELFENSVHSNLAHNHYEIIFQSSKVIPVVEVFVQGGQVIILFATIHAAHRLCLNAPHIRTKDKSILQGLSLSHFDAESNNTFHLPTPENYVTLACGLTGGLKKQAAVAIFAFGLSNGNISIVKMPHRGPSAFMSISRASRMSRIWSGINPWAGSGVGETPVCLELVCLDSSNPKVVGVCRDNRIRVWSCKSLECESQFDLRTHFEDLAPQQETYKHRISCLFDGSTDSWLISIYCASESHPRVINFEANKSVTSMDHSSTYQCITDNPAGTSHLVDFKLQSLNHLWALWLDPEEAVTMAVCDMTTGIWHEVALANPPLPEILIPSNLSVGEAFMKQLFDSAKFSPLAIVRAIAIHQKALASTRNLTINLLREKVLILVEQEVSQLLLNVADPSEDEMIDATLETWQKFYSTCVQYQQFVSKPVGICVSSSDSLTVVKKNNVSHLVPISTLEAVCRGSDASLFQTIFPEEVNFDDLGNLLSTLTLLSCVLGPDFFDSIHQALQEFDNPIEAVGEWLGFVKELICDNYELEASMVRCVNIVSAAEKLVLCLEPASFDHDLVSQPSTLFNGDRGLEVLCRSVERYVSDRLHLSLLLLIFSMLDDELENTFPQRVMTFVQVYHALLWCVTEKAEHVSQSSIESTMQTLSMQERSVTSTTDEEQSSSGLLGYFLRNEGGELVECILRKTCPEYDGVLGHQMAPHSTAAVVQILWPLGPTLAFQEFLLSKGQFSRLHRYLDRELGSWCEYCPVYVRFMLAHCQLKFGKYNKAVKTFVEAGGNLGQEGVLLDRVLQIEDKSLYSQRELEVLYYTKILQIFESLGLSEQCIVLAKHAIGQCEKSDSNLPILCSSVFSHCMELGRHDEAYSAIVSNPDPAHRKDCLRAMVVALCEKREYKTLVEYPYGDMLDDLVSILEHRARSTDLLASGHNYYNLLFSFHVYRRDYRRASSAMYEQAWRLGVESLNHSVTSLKRQHTCLVATVTCLQLVGEDNRWLVHPITTQGKYEETGASPKRDVDGDVVRSVSDRKVVIKELGDVQKEALLIEMKLKIFAESKQNAPAIGSSMTSQETLPLLTHGGLYDEAFQLCDNFNLCKLPVFESIATRCVKASYACDDEGLTWVSRNGGQTSALDHGHSSVSDRAWRLLRDYLDQHSTTGSSSAHRSVLKVVLGYGVTVPAWFTADYKKSNCPELLRLLICYDYLEEATKIACDYLDAVLGVGKEHFNIKETLSSAGGTVWIPYNEIANLLVALEEAADERHSDLYDQLDEKLTNYFEEVEKIAGMVEQSHHISIAYR